MPVLKRNNYNNLWQSIIKDNQSSKQFEEDVIRFHAAHKTPIRQLPTYVIGHKINLRKLFISVVRKGGYKVVNDKEKWDEVVEDLNLVKPLQNKTCNDDFEESCCLNAAFATQMLYSRYLEHYERWQWANLSNTVAENSNSINTADESNSSDKDLTRHSNTINELTQRDKSFFAQYIEEMTPRIYNDRQHLVSTLQREDNGLSCDLRQLSELSKLRLSLLSGLNNEIELVLNSLLIMSSTTPGSHLPPVHLWPDDLTDLLTASIGVCHSYLMPQFQQCHWMQSMLQLWNNIVDEGCGRVFLIPNIFDCSKSEFNNLCIKHNSSRFTTSTLNQSVSLLIDPLSTQPSNKNMYYNRIHTVLTIFYNISLSAPVNNRTLSHNTQLLRLLLLSIHSQLPQLRHLGLQIMSRLHIVLQEPELESDDCSWLSCFILKELLESLLTSPDRYDRISAHEMIQTLCLIEDNHPIISDHINPKIIISLSSHLILPDIHPICSALETLVSLSQLGEALCRRMALITPLLRILLQYIQIEAQIFGPSAVYKIRTFNHRPPQPFQPPQQPQQFIRLPMPSTPNHYSLSPFYRPPTPNIHQSIQPGSFQSSPSATLTPLQQINHLLNKSLASFNSPVPQNNSTQSHASVSIVSQVQNQPNVINNSPKSLGRPGKQNTNKVSAQIFPISNGVEECKEKRHNSFNRANKRGSKSQGSERKIVKIKCFQDDPVESKDTELCKEVNNNNNDNVTENLKDTNDSKCETVRLSENHVQPLTKIESISVSDDDSIKLDKNICNGFILNHDNEHDSHHLKSDDRTQMPPPSMPPPSMLKKQMQLANGIMMSSSSLLTSSITNHHHHSNLSHKNLQRQLSSEMTQGSTALIEWRINCAKRWLLEHYIVSEDNKSSVSKQELVAALQRALTIDEGDEYDATNESSINRRFLSAHELHNCIKEVFGSTVQVKVEHSNNGISQLIYSHLTKKKSLNGVDNMGGSCESMKYENSEPNGFVTNSNCNGFINHSVSNGICNTNNTTNIDNNDGNMNKDKDSSRSRFKLNNIDRSISTQQRYIRRVCRRRQRIKYKLLTRNRRRRNLSIKNLINKSNKSYPIPPSPSTQILVTPYQCLWNNCNQYFSSINLLQHHLTTLHVSSSVSTNNSTSPNKLSCLWSNCTSGLLSRAPLSLLSHVLDVHCKEQQNQSSNSPNNSNVIMTNGTVISQHPPTSSMVMTPTPMPMMMRPNTSTNVGGNLLINSQTISAVAEKSGWSVLTDQFRLEQSLFHQQQLPEGPITRHIRISAALILRNMARHSLVAKQYLQSHEKNLVSVAMSDQDCAPIIIQCLDELDHPSQSQTTPIIPIASMSNPNYSYQPSSVQNLVMASFNQLLHPFPR